jgi:hypothetical protein
MRGEAVELPPGAARRHCAMRLDPVRGRQQEMWGCSGPSASLAGIGEAEARNAETFDNNDPKAPNEANRLPPLR